MSDYIYKVNGSDQIFTSKKEAQDYVSLAKVSGLNPICRLTPKQYNLYLKFRQALRQAREKRQAQEA